MLWVRLCRGCSKDSVQPLLPQANSFPCWRHICGCADQCVGHPASCPLQDRIHLLSAGVHPWIREFPEECRSTRQLGTAGSLGEIMDIARRGVVPSPWDGLAMSWEGREECWFIWQTQWLSHCEANEHGHLCPTKHQPSSLCCTGSSSTWVGIRVPEGHTTLCEVVQ